ncbi:MAG: MBL fold metallo-hydrolase [Leptospiraceae bacterium]|nr:MBL fold metallo-hydrolase [Leptospiraceae bacterium]
MRIEHFYLKCLAHGSYMVTNSGKAAVIDPQRDIDDYIKLAKELNVQITHVINTHHHADFVSGHLELAEKTGAKIYLGSKANASFEHVSVKDGEILKLGEIDLKILETPGHTPESICVLATDGKNPPALFTGDTLFIGEVGRPDLLDGIMEPKDLASMLYDSLHNKIMTLPDDTIVYPAHGAGSQCGKNISDDLHSTLGEQKKTNYALRIPSREEFIETVLDGMPTPPAYFKHNAMLNKMGPEGLEKVKTKIKPLSVQEFKANLSDSTIVIDSRKADDFWESFIPGSVNIPLEGQFASWVGTVIPFHSKILVIANPENLDETITRLARTGYDNIIGYLEGGIKNWSSAGENIQNITRTDISEIDLKNTNLLDVRKAIETKSGKITESALTIPLQEFDVRISEVPENANLLVYCGSGYRSSIAASMILRKYPNTRISDLRGGYNAWFSANQTVGV